MKKRPHAIPCILDQHLRRRTTLGRTTSNWLSASFHAMCRAAGSGPVRGAQRSREARALPPARWAEGWVLRGEGEPPRSILLGVRGALLRQKQLRSWKSGI